MCFRPSPVSSSNDNINQGTCPTCGMPVAAEAGTTSGTCPYCGEPIPPNDSGQGGTPEDPKNVRIL